MSNSVTPWTAAHQASLFFSISQSLLRFMSIESLMLSNHLILYCPLLLIILPISIFLICVYIVFLLLSSHWVMSNSLWPHELQHSRLLCPSISPWVYSNLCPLSRWCHPAISFSITPLSSCLQYLSASGSFQWISSSHQVARVVELQLQPQSFQWTPRTDLL